MSGSAGPGAVVVIEDELDILGLLKDALSEEGYDTIALAHPDRVKQLNGKSHAELFLMDLMLPGMNGIELAGELRNSRFADTPMIAMSASRTMLREAAESHLFQETIAKPFDLLVLLDCVERYVPLGD